VCSQQPRHGNNPSVYQWLNNKNVKIKKPIYKMEYYSGTEKKEILPFETPWMT
jgi:hypothetical protein